jgi:hypothetical protein
MHFQLIELIDERVYPKWEMGKTAPKTNWN